MKVYNIALGDYERYEKIKYPAGELQVRLKQSEWSAASTADLVVVSARVRTAEDLIETCHLCSAMRDDSKQGTVGAGSALDAYSESQFETAAHREPKGSSRQVILVLPYLPYARADRRFVTGDCFGLEVFANILNGLQIPVVTLDVHSAISNKLIERLNSIEPTSLIRQAIRHSEDVSASSRLTLLFPDDGAKKRYSVLGDQLDVDVLHCMKVRDKATGKLSRFSVPAKEEFKNANVLLIDDICDGGGTFLGIADAMKEYGFKLSLYVTHGIFSKGLEPLLKRFDRMYTTDSFVSGCSDPRLFVLPTGDLFEEAAKQSMRAKIGL